MTAISQIKTFDRNVRLLKITEYSFLAAVFVLPFSKALLELFLTISCVSWLVSKILDQTPLCTKKGMASLIGFFIISSSISAFGCGYPLIAVHGIFKLIKYSMVFLVSAELFQDPVVLKRLFKVGLICFCLIVFDSLVQYFSGKDLILGLPLQFTDRQIRITGPFMSYGLLAAFLIATLPLIATVVFKKRANWFYRVPLAFLGVITMLLLYKTQSRGAWIAAAGSWLLFVLLMRKRILFIVLLVIFFTIPRYLPYNALVHLDAQREEQSVIERYQLWNRALDVIRARPLFGCGINTYILNYPKYDRTKSWRVPGYYVHNGYLQLAAETGLTSLSLFLFIFALSLSSGYHAFRKSLSDRKLLLAGLISGLVALLLQVLVDTTLHNLQTAVLIWFMAGLLIAVVEAEQSNLPL